MNPRHPSYPAFYGILPIVLVVTVSLTVIGLLFGSLSARAAGPLTVEIIAGYNLVVDSNVTSPSSRAPSVATVIGKFCNNGSETLSGVKGFIGDWKDNLSASTPGLYPTRTRTDPGFLSQHPFLDAGPGVYAFQHLGGKLGLQDASRLVGTLAPGECQVQYWHFTYPRRENPDNTGPDPVWGQSNTPADDLWLEFDVWTADSGGNTANATHRMTMRSVISAMANKIEPNGGVWFNTEGNVIFPGDVITSNGVNYDLGNINKGFDNDGDYVYDYNAWLQPVGDPAYDPSCFRLIRTTGTLTVTRSGGLPKIYIPFEDSLYFSNLPANNNSVRGTVHYTFLALDGPCSTGLSPYQEAASGADNEKFNGDWGGMLPAIGSYTPEVKIDKDSSPKMVSAGGTIEYEVAVRNTGQGLAGIPLNSMPLVISDTLPAGTTLQNSISAEFSFPNSGYDVYYSADGGKTWTESYSSAANVVQVWLRDPLPAGQAYTMTMNVIAPTFAEGGVIANDACVSFGSSACFDQATTYNMLAGPNSVGDMVWQDDDGDGVHDPGEPGLADVTIRLYWDRDGDGILDEADPQVMSTSSSGHYSFGSLPDGDFIVQVDTQDPDLPFGYASSSKPLYVIQNLGEGSAAGENYLQADFGFAPVLSLIKTQTSENPAWEGQQVTYSIRVQNGRPGTGQANGPCIYTTWASEIDSANKDSGNKSWQDIQNLYIPPGPDGLFATAPLNNAAEEVGVRGFSLGQQIGGIQKVEILLPLAPVVTSGSSINGTLQVHLSNSTTGATHSQTLNLATLQNGTQVVEVPVSAFPLAWSDFDGSRLNIHLIAKSSGKDNGDLNVDAVGIRVTSDQVCGGSGDTIDPLPLTDTYDPSKLQFLSADPAVSSVNPVTGVLEWQNLGPLYPGETKVVSLTFLALEPQPKNRPTDLVNTVSVTGAKFANGRPVNNASAATLSQLMPSGTISGYVWADSGGGNADGIWNGSEPGLEGVLVKLQLKNLQNGNFSDYETSTTDRNGHYRFTVLPNNTYRVVVTPGTNFSQTHDPDVPNKCTLYVTCNNRTDDKVLNNSDGLTNNDDYSGLDFGYTVPAAIFGSIWEDHDGDGVREAGEDGLPGRTVHIFRNNLTDAHRTTTTDSKGEYRFNNLESGQYRVWVDTNTLPTGGTWTNTAYPANGSAHQSPIVAIGSGSYIGPYDFGYHRSGSLEIGDTIFVDWNSNAVQDSGDEGLAGVTVHLYEDQNGNGQVDAGEDALAATTLTNSTGVYRFSNLAGVSGGLKYVVVVDRASGPTPSEFRQTKDPDQTDICTTCDSQAGVTLTNGSVLTVDFGYQPYGFGTIGDSVWNDADHDGIQDGTESGIPAITLRLYEDGAQMGIKDPGDALISTTVSGPSGGYLFRSLRAGSYLVEVDSGDADLPDDSQGEPYVLSTGGVLYPVALQASDEFRLADFGFTAGGRIGDLLWQDHDGDGTQDPYEPGLAGALVELYRDLDADGAIDAGGSAYKAQATTASGEYLFRSLPAGAYIVRIVPPAGFSLTGDPDETGLCTVCDGQTPLRLTPGGIDQSNDFGLRPAISLGDTIWVDADGNQQHDEGEAGVRGAPVALYRNSTAGAPVATTMTDLDGNYSFGGMTAGTYVIVVNDGAAPVDLSASYDPDGSFDHQTSFTLSGEPGRMDLDFAYRYTGDYSISGFTFFDADAGADASGYRSNVDSPLAGLTVYLWKEGAGQIAAAAASVNGSYTFSSLPPGNYTVSTNPKAPSLTGLALTLPGSANYRPVTLTSASAEGVDFGFYGTLDYGDLPAKYNLTRFVREGARHILDGPVLGALAELDPDGTEDERAGGDLQDEGVIWTPGVVWTVGPTGGSFDVTVSGCAATCYLSAWMDWGNDGDFEDAGERILVDFPLNNGTQTIRFPIPEGTSLTGIFNTRFRLYPTSTGGLAQPNGAVEGGEVEDYQFYATDGVQTPVTLSFFHAERAGEIVRFEWSTSTETGNLGFNLFVESDGDLLQINPGLLPSRVVDSLTRQDYAHEATVPAGEVFWIEDVSALGKLKRHGPLRLGQVYGDRESEDLIDWEAIQAEHTALAEERLAARMSDVQAIVEEIQPSPELPIRTFMPLLQPGEVSPENAAAAQQINPLQPQASEPEPLLRLLVSQTGMYRVTYEGLLAAGVDLSSISPFRLTLLNQGGETPMFMPAGGRFSPGSYFEFYGEALDSLYTRENVYTLAVGGCCAERVGYDRHPPSLNSPAASYYMETAWVENDRAYTSYPQDGDPWVNTFLMAGTIPASYSFPVEIDHYLPGSAPVSVGLNLWGASELKANPDHHLKVLVNDQEIWEEWFDGIAMHPMTITLPEGSLVDGMNQLKLTLPGDTGAVQDLVALDHYAVTYPRAFIAREGQLTFQASGKRFQVDGFPSPNVVVYRILDGSITRLQHVEAGRSSRGYQVTFSGIMKPATYVVAAEEALGSPGFEPARPVQSITDGPAEYLIISHPDFISGLAPLVAARQRRGFDVRVVSVEDVYDQFGFGLFDPEAIHQYIVYAAQNMGARYILLVGGDTYDYHNSLGTGSISFIPSLYAATSRLATVVPVDPLLADVDGDGLPDLPIGRLPVRTVKELEGLVGKILAYERKSYPQTAIFAADKMDGSMSFTNLSNGFVQKLPAGWSVKKAYLDESAVAAARTTLLQGINQGAALVTFTGHSGANRWTASGLLGMSDVTNLTNAGRPTVVIQWGCWNTYYISPSGNTLAQKFLVSGDRGAATLLGASTLTEAASEEMLGNLLMGRLAQPGMTIGEAVQAAKAELAQTHPELLDVLLGWTLLGDPALQIQP